MPVALQSWRASAVHASDVNSRDLMLAAINDLFVAEAIANPSTYKWVVANFNAGTGQLVLKPSVNNVGAATRRICFFVTVAGTFNQAALGLQTYPGADGVCIGYSQTADVDTFDNSQHSGAPFNVGYIGGGVLVGPGSELAGATIDRFRYYECDAGLVVQAYRPSTTTFASTGFMGGAGELLVTGDNETAYPICWSTGDQDTGGGLINAYNGWTADSPGSISAGNQSGSSTMFPAWSTSGQTLKSLAASLLPGWGAPERVSRCLSSGTWLNSAQNFSSNGLGMDSDSAAFFIPLPIKRNSNGYILGKMRQIALGPRAFIGDTIISDAVVIAKSLAMADNFYGQGTLWFTEFYV